MKNKKTYKIYCHTNKTNNKKYIGVTCQSPNRRWRNGSGYKNNILFYRAIKKYGWDNFEHLILFDRLSKEEAENIEIELIAYHKSNDPNFGYNIEKGGSLRKEVSEETRKKMSIAKKGKNCGKNHYFYGKHHSEETKKKLSIANRGRKVSEETKKKLSIANKGESNSFYGRKHSEETKKKIGKKSYERMIGKHHSEETKKKMSESKKGSKNHLYNTGIPIICLESKEIFNNANRVAERFNIKSPGDICKNCKNKIKSVNGLHFMYFKDYNENEDYSYKIKDTYRKKVLCIETNKIFLSISECSRIMNVCVSSICNNLKGKIENAKGYHFVYYNNE